MSYRTYISDWLLRDVKWKCRIILRIFQYAFLSLTIFCFGYRSILAQMPIDSFLRQSVSVSESTASQMGRHFKRVIIIVLENQNYEDAIADPYLGFLANQGASFTDFHGLFHPSYPNYLAMVAGKKIPTEGNKQINLDEPTIADLLKSKGLPWKNYAEGYPGGCFKGSTYGRYVRKHVPFMSFIPVQQHECNNVVPASRFAEDLWNNPRPTYMFYSPDLDNDGHDTGLAYASRWLKGFLEPLRQNQAFMKDTLVIVTFDESRKGLYDTNHIYTVFLGDMVKPGKHEENYNHYNVLRTIEENFGLGTLADGDGGAKSITGVWK